MLDERLWLQYSMYLFYQPNRRLKGLPFKMSTKQKLKIDMSYIYICVSNIYYNKQSAFQPGELAHQWQPQRRQSGGDISGQDLR